MEEVREPEVWKDIPGYEGLYQVSSWGNVKVLDRFRNQNMGNFKRSIFFSSRLLKPGCDKSGYLRVVFSVNSKRIIYKVHRLVAFVFYGYEGIINHIDENKSNNYYKNLEQVNTRENVSYSLRKKIGVCYHKAADKWMASFWYQNRNVYLGLFITEEEAHQAYLNALKEHCLENKYANGNQSL